MKSLRELYRIGSGPSSSHTMAPERACEYVKRLNPEFKKAQVFLYGSLALTGKGHFTDKVILKVLGDNTEVIFDYKTKVKHPNTFKIIVDNKVYNFISSGGGEIKLDNKIIESYNDIYPFKGYDDIKKYVKDNNIDLAQVVYRFEDKDIKDYLALVYKTMVESINRGLNTEGVLPGKLEVKRKAKDIIKSSSIDNDKNNIISYAYAVSEENASVGRIVTAPTCGSCGVLPSVLYNYELSHNIKKEKIYDALAVASLIGNVIKERATLSGAVAGCQAEIGSACSMASAALAYLNGLSIDQIEASSEIAMEHHLGLTCDPIDGYVQIPCIERNAIAALRALDAAYMASLPIYPEKLSFDMVVDTMILTGKDLKSGYKETSKAGLAKINIWRK